ncbi:MAG: hypothetical protein K2J12_01425 [Muribaculaceae bacterium]|nr:hypothetical protein [Muribaculaceae bacterium]
MKKFLFLLMLCVSFITYAEEATTSCMVGGSSTDYVSATAYTTKGSGYVTIANSANKPLVSLYITVNAEACTYSNGELLWHPVTLLQKNVYFSPAISPNQTTRVECNKVQSYDGKLRNITVSIGNPSCK